MSQIELRPEVRWFAEQMELQLQANDWKGGWHNDGLAPLYGRLREEMQELEYAIFPRWQKAAGRILLEAADVANFAMMLADNAQREASRAGGSSEDLDQH